MRRRTASPHSLLRRKDAEISGLRTAWRRPQPSCYLLGAAPDNNRLVLTRPERASRVRSAAQHSRRTLSGPFTQNWSRSTRLRLPKVEPDPAFFAPPFGLSLRRQSNRGGRRRRWRVAPAHHSLEPHRTAAKYTGLRRCEAPPQACRTLQLSALGNPSPLSLTSATHRPVVLYRASSLRRTPPCPRYPR